MEKPTLLYDGDCYFCRSWVNRWRKTSGHAVEFRAYQEAGHLFSHVPSEELKAAIQLIDSQHRYSGAEAVFKTLAYGGQKGPLFLYQKLPFFKTLSETLYRFVASHRNFFSKLTRLFWGTHLEKSEYAFSSWIFMRLLGLSYLFAFGALIFQWRGLWGHQGILPAQMYLQALKSHFREKAYFLSPTLSWLFKPDAFLGFMTWGGTFFSLLIVLGIAEGPLTFLCWLFYLSLVSTGQDFLSFQWDILLLEIGLISFWMFPWRLWRGREVEKPRPAARILLFFLLFKLFFESGLVKILSGDPNWRNFTALFYHFQTQPLPTWIGWWAAQSPSWLLKISALSALAVELGAPFLLFLPRRAKMLGAALMIFLQTLIALTGNYGFFNLLTIALCVLCFDDFFFQEFFRGYSSKFHLKTETKPLKRLKRILIFSFAGLWGLLSLSQLLAMLIPQTTPKFLEDLDATLSPLHIASSYGPFAVMTTHRYEIIIQGSADGVDWEDYDFKWKPQDLERAPSFVEPYQPRLDWQMWFAALEPYQRRSWFTAFLVRLLEGSPNVLSLLRSNPFGPNPPKYVRALIYEYHFTSSAERRLNGHWWKRQFQGAYCPILALKGDQDGI